MVDATGIIPRGAGDHRGKGTARQQAFVPKIVWSEVWPPASTMAWSTNQAPPGKLHKKKRTARSRR